MGIFKNKCNESDLPTAGCKSLSYEQAGHLAIRLQEEFDCDDELSYGFVHGVVTGLLFVGMTEEAETFGADVTTFSTSAFGHLEDQIDNMVRKLALKKLREALDELEGE